LAVVYIGVFPTVVGFLAWNEGVRRLGPSGAMVFYNMLPVYGALLGALLLHDPLGMTHLIGGLLIIGAGFWAGSLSTPSKTTQPYWPGGWRNIQLIRQYT